MNLESMLRLAKKELGLVILVGLLVSAASFAVLVVSQKNFRASSDLLVVQNQNGFSDYYALSKSADFLSGVLVESIYSEKFLDEINTTKIVSESFLPLDKKERLDEWNKIVKISKNSNAGILNIEVFGNSQKQVVEISDAILDVLKNKSFLFLGKGQDIDIRVLSGPIYEKNPSFVSIFLAVGGGFFVGALLALMWIFYRAQLGNSGIIFSAKDASEKELSPEEETERRAQEYWNSRYSNKQSE
ncbi:MAG: hypothetical protein WC823_01110 [Parcubacteria group bacterium]